MKTTCISLGSLLFLSSHANARLRWFDGSGDDATQPPGKLLSDNEDYYGDCVLTGVEYRYEIAPDKPADDRPGRTGKLLRTLLNGCCGQGVGLSNGRPLVVIFDFKRQCIFNEIDVVTPSKKVALRIELSRVAEQDDWQMVFERSLADCPEQELHRLKLPSSPRGRYLRLSIQAPDLTLLDQVIAWGDAVNLREEPEIFEPVAKGEYPIGVAYPGITGVGKSAASDREAFYWAASLTASQKAQPAVWFQVSTWGSISHQPLLPTPAEIGRPITVVMARNETENLALALKNTAVSKPTEVTVMAPKILTADGRQVSEQDISVQVGVMGSIGDPGFGNNLGPIFHQDNMLGSSLMDKFLFNGCQIRDFPKITLHPAAAAVLWLTFTTRDAAPGRYVASIAIEGGEPQHIAIEVVAVTLPETFAFVKTYSDNLTRMFPFVHEDRAKEDLSYALDCGITDFYGLSNEENELLMGLAKARGMKLMFQAGFLIPRLYDAKIYNGDWTKAEDFPADAAEEIAAEVQKVVAAMEARGLDYDDWYGITGDEPSHKNIAAVAHVCKLIHQANPRVNVYINPCYWVGYDHGAVAEDQLVAADLADWYANEVNISMPLFFLLEDRPASLPAFTAKRLVNAYYYVSGHLDRSEHATEIQKYRRMAWDSFAYGINGWGFYSYYSPRGSAWNHFDRNPKGEGLQEPSDYSIVYPGWRRVVPTRHSEALRQGKEDWNLLHLLKQQGKHDFLATLIADYQAGADLEQLRLKALRQAMP